MELFNTDRDIKSRPCDLLPHWLPDETLFSWVSRYHFLSANNLSRTTSQMLFGHRYAGTIHDLPGKLDYFVQETKGEFGDAESILQAHTIAPALTAFQVPERIAEFVLQLRNAGQTTMKYRLGLLTAGFRANFPLKACPQCMTEDFDHYQVAYWHRTHQLPGVWICTRHGTPLQESQLKGNGVHRFGFALPAAAALSAPLDAAGRPIEFESNNALKSLADHVAALAKRPISMPLAPSTLAWVHRLALQEAGYACRASRLQLASAAERHLAHCSLLRLIPELAPLPTTQKAAEHHLQRLLCTQRVVRHPLHQLALISWLYPEMDLLLQRHDDWRPREPESTEHRHGRNQVSIDPRLIDQFSIGEISARSAAAQAGVDIKTFMTKAAAVGITAARRPKKLKGQSYAQLSRDLESGMDKNLAASRYGISVTTVTSVLRTQPGLQQRWHSARKGAAQREARNRWLSACETNPEVGSKALRLIAPSAYAWLYRNDRQWLHEHQPPKQRPAPHGRVDWDRRDAELAQQVRQVALAIYRAAPGTSRIRLQQLYQQLPELRQRLSSLSRLPLTRAAIHQATTATLVTTPLDFPQE